MRTVRIKEQIALDALEVLQGIKDQSGVFEFPDAAPEKVRKAMLAAGFEENDGMVEEKR